MDIPQVREFKHVTLGYVMGLLAIIERSSGEPIDFIGERTSPLHVERLLAQWDAYFEIPKR